MDSQRVAKTQIVTKTQTVVNDFRYMFIFKNLAQEQLINTYIPEETEIDVLTHRKAPPSERRLKHVARRFVRERPFQPLFFPNHLRNTNGIFIFRKTIEKAKKQIAFDDERAFRKQAKKKSPKISQIWFQKN